ncbi:protein-disulfide reductase DsbD domain-containing protein [Fodinicurvata sp. EGI_FJ10296]|uniref:protein-disulfide reductase DsbD family protein n=1 Tax=Fodinicurvata sp. EGI_FJ10296 TaxID=3231908 RepID=UPI003451C042
MVAAGDTTPGTASVMVRLGVCILLLLATLPGIAGTGSAIAGQGQWVTDTVSPDATVRARLIAAADATGGASTLRAGVEIELPGDWKTYWRSPGDAGIPPSLDLSQSSNLTAVDFQWPAPERFSLFGLQTFGYGDRVVFPLLLTPESAGEPMRLRGRLEALICDDICVPTEFDLALDLDGGPATIDSDSANLIDRFRARIPDDGTVSGLTVTQISLAPDLGELGGLRVHADRSGAGSGNETVPDAIIESRPGWAFEAPRISATDDTGFVAELPFAQTSGPAEDLIGTEATVTLVDGAAASETAMPVTAADDVAGSGGGPGVGGLAPWVLMIGLALAGGFILNAMPCVLPVLSLKLMSVVGYSGAAPGVVRSGFLWSAAGIVTSFMALAGLAIGVKAAGGAVGWGMQFQQPLFLIFIIVVLTGFALNLAGLIRIELPHTAATRLGLVGGTSPTGPGAHFATGAFATLLATPCSAPFLGTAVAFALSRGPSEIVVIFLALGFGMALPYLLVAALPSLVRFLPRPGRWMHGVRTVMALALTGTALWLLTVLGAQIGDGPAAVVGAMMAATAAALWYRRRLSGRPRIAATAAGAVVAALAFIVPVQAERMGSAGAESGETRAVADGWRPFDRPAIAEQVARGRVVFVDVTAAWCLTCQVNKSAVLERGDIAERLSADGLTAMRADWTRPDPAISEFLSDHGRFGIPFNIVYGPGAPDGIALPEILTSGMVADALDRAAASG